MKHYDFIKLLKKDFYKPEGIEGLILGTDINFATEASQFNCWCPHAEKHLITDEKVAISSLSNFYRPLSFIVYSILNRNPIVIIDNIIKIKKHLARCGISLRDLFISEGFFYGMNLYYTDTDDETKLVFAMLLPPEPEINWDVFKPFQSLIYPAIGSSVYSLLKDRAKGSDVEAMEEGRWDDIDFSLLKERIVSRKLADENEIKTDNTQRQKNNGLSKNGIEGKTFIFNDNSLVYPKLHKNYFKCKAKELLATLKNDKNVCYSQSVELIRAVNSLKHPNIFQIKNKELRVTGDYIIMQCQETGSLVKGIVSFRNKPSKL